MNTQVDEWSDLERRAKTEAILREGGPYFTGPEASVWDREVTPEIILRLIAQVRKFKKENIRAHHRIVLLTHELGWAFDGTLDSALYQLEEVLRRRDSEIDFLTNLLTSIKTLINDWEQEYSEVPIDVLRSVLENQMFPAEEKC